MKGGVPLVLYGQGQLGASNAKTYQDSAIHIFLQALSLLSIGFDGTSSVQLRLSSIRW